jgi:hypothetical protein
LPSSIASTWADDIKEEAGYTDSGDTSASHSAARNIGYAHKLRHKYWRYIDLPFSPDHTPVQPPDPVNAHLCSGWRRRKQSITTLSTVLARL